MLTLIPERLIQKQLCSCVASITILWKNVYKQFKISTDNYLKMYPEEFIYLPLYGQQEITANLTSINQPWCKNIVIVDIMNENLDFRENFINHYDYQKNTDKRVI